MRVVKVLFERKYKAGYVYRRELWQHGKERPTEIVACYTPSGDYIGGARDARYFCVQRALSRLQKTHPSHCVCSIGFSRSKRKWYGWSHRAIFGYGVGDVAFYEFVHVRRRIKTLAAAKRSAMRFAQSVS